MNTRQALIVASAILTATTVTGAHAAVTFTGAEVTATSNSYATDDVTQPQNVDDSKGDATLAFTTTPLFAEADTSASAYNMGIGASATDYDTATVSFSTPSAGSFVFKGDTSAMSNSTDPGVGSEASGGGSATYGFITTSTEKFNLFYSYNDVSLASISLTNNVLAYSLVSSVVSGPSIGYGYFVTNGSGYVSYILPPGEYSFTAMEGYFEDLAASPAIVSGLLTDNHTGSHNDFYNFSISGAPEPSAWMLIIVGVGLVGGMLRSRRPVAAV